MSRRFSTPRAARAVLVLRALITAAAALVVTFVQERTPEFALGVFQIFALLMAVLLFADSLFVRPKRSGTVSRVLGALHLLAGSLASLLEGSPEASFHWILIGWALAAGLFEALAGLVAVRGGAQGAARVEGRDRLVVGALTVLLGVVSLIVSPQYALDYVIEEAGQSFTLTGTIIGVGLFGGWAAIVAVYLGIGALSPAPASRSEKDAS